MHAMMAEGSQMYSIDSCGMASDAHHARFSSHAPFVRVQMPEDTIEPVQSLPQLTELPDADPSKLQVKLPATQHT